MMCLYRCVRGGRGVGWGVRTRLLFLLALGPVMSSERAAAPTLAKWAGEGVITNICSMCPGCAAAGPALALALGSPQGTPSGGPPTHTCH